MKDSENKTGGNSGKDGCTERQHGGEAEMDIMLEGQTGALSQRPSPRTESLEHDTLYNKKETGVWSQ